MKAIRVTRPEVVALLTEHFPYPEDWPDPADWEDDPRWWIWEWAEECEDKITNAAEEQISEWQAAWAEDGYLLVEDDDLASEAEQAEWGAEHDEPLVWADAEAAEKQLKWPTVEVVWTLPRSFEAVYPLTTSDAADWLEGGNYPTDWPSWKVDDCPDTPEVLAWRNACEDALDAATTALFGLWKEEIEALGYEVQQIELYEISQYQNAFGRQKWTDEQDDEFIGRFVFESSDFVTIDWPTPPAAAYLEKPA